MAEYIEREALIARCKEIAACGWNKKTAPVCWSDAYESFADMLEEVPAADVVEVVHGEWKVVGGLLYGRDICECSNCREKETMHMSQHRPYCPNCGAKMQKEQIS